VKKLRRWLKKIREDRSLSQMETAERAGISYPYYNFIENGNRRPSPEVAKRIARVLGFPDEWYKLLESVNETA